MIDYPIKAISCRYGVIEAPDWPEDLIVKSLRLHGEWAECETALLSTLMYDNESFWDVGAFLGTFSLSLEKRVSLQNVVAVEANPSLGIVLKSNLERNLNCEVKVACCAIDKTAGWVAPIAQHTASNHGALSWKTVSEIEPDAVPALTLKELRDLYGEYTTLKIDVEGMELNVLMSDETYLRSQQPLIWAECNEALSSIKLLSMFWWLGYRVHYFAFPAFRSENFFGSLELMYPDAYEAALVAIPANRLVVPNHIMLKEDIISREILTTFDLRKALFDTPRWSQPYWSERNRAELIALLGRISLSQNLSNFLVDTE